MFNKKNVKYRVCMFICLITLVGLNYLGKTIFEKNNPEILEDVDSEYSRIWIKNIPAGDIYYKVM